ncbi:MAG: DNA-binding protein WhiA [Oscillospiraceae bacterium]|nr:DNA-binding protein WhiA [Oscillospiraceae bacterium]
MSFCSDVKNELALLKTSRCCMPSLAYGFLLFSKSFTYKKISMQTVNPVMAEFFAKTMHKVFGADVTLTEGGELKKTYNATVLSEADRLKILAILSNDDGENFINPDYLLKDCCFSAFIRGAFLACGSISNPEVEYRLDFSIKTEELAVAFSGLLEECSIKNNLSKRGNGYVVYIKKNEIIGDLLTLMGASNRSLELLDTAILKSLKNKINRASNCDSANISKTVEASINQRKAIEYFENLGILESLPTELVSAAKLRLQNPNASLKELCALSREPITVSGLNHRLRRIIDLYNEKKK